MSNNHQFYGNAAEKAQGNENRITNTLVFGISVGECHAENDIL